MVPTSTLPLLADCSESIVYTTIDSVVELVAIGSDLVVNDGLLDLVLLILLDVLVSLMGMLVVSVEMLMYM